MSVPSQEIALLAARPSSRPLWREYLVLTKPRVVALMLFTVLVGMLLAARTPLPRTLWLGAPLGIALVAGAAAAINHLVDRRIDALTARTRARPLPRGKLSGGQVLLFALVLGTAGMALLLLTTTNLLCALLTLASLLGWVAVSGALDPGALTLFLIIFIWTPPHFWALAIHRREDYARAAVSVLPVLHGVAYTTRRIWAYTLALLTISLLPVAIGMSGALYLLGALLLGARYADLSWRLRRNEGLARPSFRYSIVYLFGLFGSLLVDHFLLR